MRRGPYLHDLDLRVCRRVDHQHAGQLLSEGRQPRGVRCELLRDVGDNRRVHVTAAAAAAVATVFAAARTQTVLRVWRGLRLPAVSTSKSLVHFNLQMLL